jgi:hypothetical protein
MTFNVRPPDPEYLWKSQKHISEGMDECNCAKYLADPAVQKVLAFTGTGALIGGIAGGSPTIGIGFFPGLVIGAAVGFGVGLSVVIACKSCEKDKANRQFK